MHSAKGFGVDGEKRLWPSGPNFTRTYKNRHIVDRSIQPQIVEFLAISAPSKALRSMPRDQKTFSNHPQRIVAAVKRLHVYLGLSRFIR